MARRSGARYRAVWRCELIPVLLALLTGCTTRVERQDMLPACLGDAALAEDDRLEVRVEACVDGRAQGAELGCTVLTGEETLQVHTWLRYAVAGAAEKGCTPTATTCSSEPLDAGSYTLVYAGDTVAVEVPGTLPATCLPTQ